MHGAANHSAWQFNAEAGRGIVVEVPFVVLLAAPLHTWAMNIAVVASYRAVPHMLTAVPRGRKKSTVASAQPASFAHCVGWAGDVVDRRWASD